MNQPTKAQMKRIAAPMVQRDEDWQATLEAVKDAFNMEATDKNREIIMDVISECEDENGEKYDQKRRRSYDGMFA